MARKKKVIEAEVAEAEIKEEVIEVTDDVTEPEEATPAEVEESVAEEDNKQEQFVYAQLKAINKLNNPAKARRLAERVLRNRKR